MTATAKADVVVVGAGVVGVACATYLAKRGAQVAIIDHRPALSYTSALSTECYRNYWGGHAPMTQFMNRSIDLLEERARASGNSFSMNRRGYTFLSRTQSGAMRHAAMAAQANELGLRGGGMVHSDGEHGAVYSGSTLAYDADVDGLTAFQGRAAIDAFFSSLPASHELQSANGSSFLSSEILSVLHCGRCGWMNAQQMGSGLLEEARSLGARMIFPATLTAILAEGGGGRGSGGQLSGVVLSTPNNPQVSIACGAVVNCAGPFASHVNRLLLGVKSDGSEPADGRLRPPPPPLSNEVHCKAILRDLASAVPTEAPMMILEDAVELDWTEEERESLRSMGGFEASLADPIEGGAHFRPYGGSDNALLMLWEALHNDVDVTDPPPEEPALRDPALLAELMLRGLGQMVPGLASSYLAGDGTMRASVSVDGGYYTKTPDNLPLIGPLAGAPSGAYVCAGLSGYGVMAANAAGELLAMHVEHASLPTAYAETFLPERWCDEGYCKKVASGEAGGGLQI